MKKILCIGDSLALPGHLNTYEDTWFYKLKIEFPKFDFISFFKRGITTEMLVTMGGGEGGIDNWPFGADCLEAFCPDIVIVQLGIVDCAPRLLNTLDRVVVKIIPKYLKSLYIKLVKLTRNRKTKNTIVSLDKFRSNWINFMNRAIKINTRILVISISLPDSSFSAKNSTIHLNVNKYNNSLFQLAKEYNFSITPVLKSNNYNQPIYEDGYHPNVYGHEIIFNEIKKILNKFDE